MSSINPFYTIEYSQPDAYRFSHDSVFLARKVFELECQSLNQDSKILDLCAGCGIVGLDFLIHCKKEARKTFDEIDFLEVQKNYEEHFETNCKRADLPNTKLQFILRNFNTPLNRQYDLILCNPPYFELGSGTLSPDDFKNRCRFFIDGTPSELYRSIAENLKPSGRAYVLTRDPSAIKTSDLRIIEVADIRGTPLLCIGKKL